MVKSLVSAMMVVVVVVVVMVGVVSPNLVDGRKVTMNSNPAKEERMEAFFTHEKPMVYLHVKKTGGSTFCNMAKNNGLKAIEEFANCFWHGNQKPAAYMSAMRLEEMPNNFPPPMTLVQMAEKSSAALTTTRTSTRTKRDMEDTHRNNRDHNRNNNNNNNNRNHKSTRDRSRHSKDVEEDVVSGPVVAQKQYQFIAFEPVMSITEPWSRYAPFDDALSPFWRNAVHVISVRDPIVRFVSYIVHAIFQFDRTDTRAEEWASTKDLNHNLIDKLMHGDSKEIVNFGLDLEEFVAAKDIQNFDVFKKTPSAFRPFTRDAKNNMRENGPGFLVWSLSNSLTDVQKAACNLKTHYSAITNIAEETRMTAYIFEKVFHMDRSQLEVSTARYSGMHYAKDLVASLPRETMSVVEKAFAADICLYKYAMRLMHEHASVLNYDGEPVTNPSEMYPHVDCEAIGLGRRGPTCGASYRTAEDLPTVLEALAETGDELSDELNAIIKEVQREEKREGLV
eukprot:TRINITY_DN926_c1_g2_i3.p1 TRINITY_DN926_c1_g2~~TRINITY_DN926_c1_g2_i3.p1  ORF type:complete len:507 (-),score=127.98 TRINITY_DN926_c1_g2_i3:365-1885(-)